LDKTYIRQFALLFIYLEALLSIYRTPYYSLYNRAYVFAIFMFGVFTCYVNSISKKKKYKYFVDTTIICFRLNIFNISNISN